MATRFAIFCAASLLALPLPVLAQGGACPSGAAVDGVYARYADRVVRYQRLSDGQTAELEIYTEDGASYEYRNHPLGLVLESWETANGLAVDDGIETVTYTGAIPAPAAGVTWSGEEVSRFSDGSELRFTTSVTVEAQDVFPIGPCQYVALPITVSRVQSGTGEPSVDAFVHLPDLGVTLYLGGGSSVADIAYDLPSGISNRPPLQGGGTMGATRPPDTK